MFDEDEIKFMKEVVGLNLDFNNLSDDDYCEIEKEVGGYYTADVQTHKENEYTDAMRICRDILESLV